MSDHTSELSQTKICTKCGAEYPRTAEYFYRDKRNRDGLKGDCKTCKREYIREWKSAHREEIAKRGSMYYATCREERLEYQRKWRKANFDQKHSQEHRRRTRKRNAEGSFNAADIERQRKAQKSKCYYCGQKAKLTVEHLVPLARGGTNWPDNIVLACGPCNFSKQDKLPHEYPAGGRLL